MPSIALPVSLRGQLLSGVRSAVTVFSPADLFATGSQGIWLDPSDLTTMFSDRAGTTPVTAPGTVVGLRLDKSKGLVLGAELVGTFAAYANATFSTVGGVTTVTCSANGSYGITLGFSGAAGKTYAMTFEVLSNSASRVLYGWTSLSSSINLNAGTTTGVKSGSVLASANGSGVIAILGATAGETFSIRNISVRELAGNHAVAPTDAARPIYGVEPKGGRRNLLTWSEGFDNAAWVKERSSVAATTGGYLVTVTGASFSLLSQVVAGTSGVPVTFTVIAKAGSVGCIRIGAQNGTAGFDLVNGTATAGGTISAAGDGFYKCTVSYTGAVGQINYIYLTDVAASVPPPAIGTSLTIKSAQLELGSTATAYQRVLSAYDVTESGVATCHYVQYDGSDDSMSTAAIDFTATDKMSVFAGVRKLSDPAAGIVVESSFNVDSNNGAMILFTNPNTYGVKIRGTTTPASVNAPSSYTAPISNVITGLGDIAADTNTLRINGAQVAQGTADLGTGNLGNHPLYIGRRNNATLPFNGRDFGLIVVGKAASAGEITDTELWLSDKTAEVDVAKSISPNIYTRSGDTILDRANSIIERRTV